MAVSPTSARRLSTRALPSCGPFGAACLSHCTGVYIRAMTREPSVWHRLPELDPDALGIEAAEMAFLGLRLLRPILGHSLSVPSKASQEALRATPIYKSILDLHAWALRGVGSPAEAKRLLRQLLSLLTESALAPQKPSEEEFALDGVDVGQPLGQLCLAARARIRLTEGQRLDGYEVASLLGHRPSSTRRLSEKGELKPATTPTRYRGTLYEAADVLQLLLRRGTPGFLPQPPTRKEG